MTTSLKQAGKIKKFPNRVLKKDRRRRILALVVLTYFSVTTASVAEPDAIDQYKMAVGQHLLKLHADSMPNYKSDVDAAQQDVLNIRKNNEKQKMFYLLRNCSELAEGQGKTLQNAISELMVK